MAFIAGDRKLQTSAQANLNTHLGIFTDYPLAAPCRMDFHAQMFHMKHNKGHSIWFSS